MADPESNATMNSSDHRRRYKPKPKTDPNPAQPNNCALAAYKNKVRISKKALVRLKQQKDTQLDAVVRDLLALEAHLRQEQKHIYGQLAYRDQTITSQKLEIEQLRRENRRLVSRCKKNHDNPDTQAAPVSEPDRRVLHKPPIAQKPKLSRKTTAQRDETCNIVSTISQLLAEESDQGVAMSGSETSSPESTLKPLTPRVIKLARQYEKGLITNIEPTFLTDDHEVTSGYNSETVSEQEPDCENTLKQNDEHFDGDYVVFNVIRATNPPLEADDDEDLHLYSNIEYHNGEEVLPHDATVVDPTSLAQALEDPTSLAQALEDPLDNSDTASEATTSSSDSLRSVKNVPRTRGNIDQIIDYGDSHIMQNFEEFSLDSLDLDDFDHQYAGKENQPEYGFRQSGDGSEEDKISGSKEPPSDSTTPPGVGVPRGGGYEKFLEATGLSQKSILTPSRMFSNHRSMLKPRDIKHRDKLRTTFTGLSTLEENTVDTSTTSSSHRYWSEQYL